MQIVTHLISDNILPVNIIKLYTIASFRVMSGVTNSACNLQHVHTFQTEIKCVWDRFKHSLQLDPSNVP